MKITIWIRRTPADDGVTLRTDAKYENLDTPTVQNFGHRLMAAVKSCAKGKEDND